MSFEFFEIDLAIKRFELVRFCFHHFLLLVKYFFERGDLHLAHLLLDDVDFQFLRGVQIVHFLAFDENLLAPESLGVHGVVLALLAFPVGRDLQRRLEPFDVVEVGAGTQSALLRRLGLDSLKGLRRRQEFNLLGEQRLHPLRRHLHLYQILGVRLQRTHTNLALVHFLI